MKFFVLWYLFFSYSLLAQNKKDVVYYGDTIQVTRYAYSNEQNEYLHKIANYFSMRVGKRLKEVYPARVKDICISLQYSKVYKKLKLTYIAILEPCFPWESNTIFDHRGALSIRSGISIWTYNEDIKNTRIDTYERSIKQLNHSLTLFKKIYVIDSVFKDVSSQVEWGNNNFAICNEQFIVGHEKKK